MKLNVEGMHCEGCENRIKNVLNNIEGVEEVKASYIKNEVEIKSNKELDLNLIKEKIENLGFIVK